MTKTNKSILLLAAVLPALANPEYNSQLKEDLSHYCERLFFAIIKELETNNNAVYVSLKTELEALGMLLQAINVRDFALVKPDEQINKRLEQRLKRLAEVQHLTRDRKN